MSGTDRVMVVRASVYLILADLALRFGGFQRVIGAVGRPVAADRTPQEGDVRLAYFYAGFLSIASRHLPIRAHCLHRSVALQFWLRHDGLPSQVEIGVRKDNSELKAHAWVNLGGWLVDEQPAALQNFSPLRARRGASAQAGEPDSLPVLGGRKGAASLHWQ